MLPSAPALSPAARGALARSLSLWEEGIEDIGEGVGVHRDGAQIPVGRLDALMMEQDLDDEQRVDRRSLGGELLEAGQHHAGKGGPQLVTRDPQTTCPSGGSEDVLIGVLAHRYTAVVDEEGIGNPRALKILGKANVDAFKKIQDLGEDEVNRIRQVIENEGEIEGDLRKDVSMHIKRLIDIQSYRGLRHRRNLPVRGQRTHTNARTRKGPRKGTIAGKKKATAKT